MSKIQTENLFGGNGDWFQYRNKFNCPAIPTRMKNAIESELNSPIIGRECILPVPGGMNLRELIPNWLVILWIESETIHKLPNIGASTINETLKAIAHCLSE